ncbi:tripartite tricarboxylate transporter substrate binding protein [Comamonas sp. w2-DMI]|uniref:Bug family tripartite tricarboxylate transporter substrate binding protein n=1 Tax=Comamonas sp. w2-DMI TaxID=3126391 RepID=UPI0032E47BF3
MTFTRRIFCAMTALGFAFSPCAHAQEWPAKQPIRVIVPYPAGGNADSAVRALGEAIGGPLKQTVIVDNRPGASSIIGTEAVARAPADGYTIGVVSDSHAINQAMAKYPKAAAILGAKVPYDAQRDFVPVAGTILIPLVLVVNPKVPARSVKELVQLSKSRNSGMNFGTMGTGSPWSIHMHQINEATGAVFVDVPYKGLAPAATDLIGGQTDTMLMPVHYAQQYIKTGKLVPIATLGAKRHPLLPEVPTLVESGYPGLEISNYIFFVAPAATPPAIVQRLGQELNAALKTPAMKDKLAMSGDPYPAEPAELSARLARDIATYGKVIQNTLK